MIPRTLLVVFALLAVSLSIAPPVGATFPYPPDEKEFLDLKLVRTHKKTRAERLKFDGHPVAAFTRTIVDCNPVPIGKKCTVNVEVSAELAFPGCDAFGFCSPCCTKGDAIRMRVKINGSAHPNTDITVEPEPNSQFYAARKFEWVAGGFPKGNNNITIDVEFYTIFGTWAETRFRTLKIDVYQELGP